MLMVRLTVILVAGIPNTTERLTTSSFVQDLMCSQNDQVMHPDLCGVVAPPIVVQLNYAKFAAEYLI